MLNCPSGTVTFLFTDSEGSTKLARRGSHLDLLTAPAPMRCSKSFDEHPCVAPCDGCQGSTLLRH